MHVHVGHPNMGWVAQILRRTIGQYRYALRHAKSQKQHVKHFKLLEAIFSNYRDFCKEVPKICGFNQYDNSCIDRLKGSEPIYNKLYFNTTNCLTVTIVII